jgi:hypothetical protein
MGYYTYHTLSVFDKDMKYLDDVTGKHEVLLNNKVFPDDNDDCNYLFSDSCKWYDCEEDMIKHSLEYPDLIFEIHGEGEESKDFWKIYVHNGKIQHSPVTIKYDEFNFNKLK